MSAAAFLRYAVPAALIALPAAAWGQTKSECGMPDEKPPPAETKSERALPTQTEEAAPVPASKERAMPAKDK